MKYLGTLIVALALAAPAAAQTGPATDLFAFSQGARLVQVPDDAEFTAMDSSPFNLIDGSATTDWTGEAGWPAVSTEEHTSALQSLMRISSAVLCFKKNNNNQ